MDDGKRKTNDEYAGYFFLILSMIPRNQARDGIMLLGAVVLVRCH
jgi:hypothetical protein